MLLHEEGGMIDGHAGDENEHEHAHTESVVVLLLLLGMGGGMRSAVWKDSFPQPQHH